MLYTIEILYPPTWVLYNKHHCPTVMLNGNFKFSIQYSIMMDVILFWKQVKQIHAHGGPFSYSDSFSDYLDNGSYSLHKEVEAQRCSTSRSVGHVQHLCK